MSQGPEKPEFREAGQNPLSSQTDKQPAPQPSQGRRKGSSPRHPSAKPSAQQSKIGSYRILERIGAGGMGTVYRAIHTELEREVALKVLPAETSSNPTMVARFKREARAAAQLHHENIVQIYDVSEDRGRHFLALEFVHGKDLSDLIAEKNRIPIKNSIEILKQAARALDHAYQKGIVHRDIKPSNFLITPEGKVKLCDLGLALCTDAGEESKVTRIGTTVGTVDYMAPEQARDSRLVDTRSDIYSLGCTFYHMLTGRAPFEEGSVPERLLKHIQDPVPDPLQFNPEIPSQVLYVLNRMLEKKPEDRYQTPHELLTDLDQLELNHQDTAKISALKTLAICDEADEEATDQLLLARPGGRLTMHREKQKAARIAALKKILILGGAGAGLVIILLFGWRVFRGSDTTQQARSSATNQTPTPSSSPLLPVGSSAVPTPAPSGSSNSVESPSSGSPPSVAKSPELVVAAREVKEPEVIGESVEAAARVSAADRDRIAQELFPPWPTVAIPGAPVTLARGVQLESSGVFATLEAAFRKAQSGSSKVSMEDNGPFFERSFSVNKANLEIRPKNAERQAIQYRPIVVFDAASDRSKQPFFIQAKSSNLVIEGIDFIFNADNLRDSIGLKPFAFFDIQGGDLVLKNCTFTILGKHAQSVAIVRFSGLRDPDPVRQPERLARLTVEGCFARGEPLSAVTLYSALADIKVIDSLFVGGPMGTMFEFLPPLDPAPRPERTLRLVRSTFVTRGDFLFLDGTPPGEVTTNFKLLDSVIACANRSGARKLVRTKAWPEQAGAFAKASWDERSSLYTGWGENLVYSGTGGKLTAKTADQWLHLWGLQPSDSHVRSDPWPASELGEISGVSAGSFNASEVAQGIQSRWGAASIGCAVEGLPAASPVIQQRAFGRWEAPELLPIERLIPSHTRNTQKNPLLSSWAGEQNRRRQAKPGTLKPGDELDPVLELTFNVDTEGDLGKFLLSQPELPDTTIVAVTGTGTHQMSPIRLTGKRSLVLHFNQPIGKPPLILIPADGSESAEALIEVRDGDLIVEGAHVVWPTGTGTSRPRRFAKVDRGNLALARCQIHGPLQGDTGFEAIAFTGGEQKSQWRPKPEASAQTAPAGSPLRLDFHLAPHPRVNVCQLVDCYVGAESRCVSFKGSLGVLKLYNCVVVTPGTMASFEDLDHGGAQSFEIDVALQQNTMAASKTFFDVGDWIAPALPSRPIAIFTRDNLFCDPFEIVAGAAGRARTNVLLRYSGRTLQYGLIHWQSEFDAFSFDMHSYVLRSDASTNPRQRFDQDWLALWGRTNVRDWVVDEKKGERIRMKASGQKIKEFERDKRLTDLELQDKCEASRKASHGGAVGADLKRLGV